MDYYKTIKISKKRADFIKRALSEPGLMDDEASEAETASFLDGLYLVDVKIVGCGDEEPCWAEAVLFKRNADGTYSEISHTDVEDEFLGEWQLCDHEGNAFIVNVEVDG